MLRIVGSVSAATSMPSQYILTIINTYRVPCILTAVAQYEYLQYILEGYNPFQSHSTPIVNQRKANKKMNSFDDL